jgi:hypothetical protein
MQTAYHTTPITLYDLARFRLGRDPETIDDYASAGLPGLAGCQICGECLAPDRAHPSCTGYVRCPHHIGQLGWLSVGTADAILFPTTLTVGTTTLTVITTASGRVFYRIGDGGAALFFRRLRDALRQVADEEDLPLADVFAVASDLKAWDR